MGRFGHRVAGRPGHDDRLRTGRQTVQPLPEKENVMGKSDHCRDHIHNHPVRGSSHRPCNRPRTLEGDFDRTTLARVAGVEKARKTVWILAFASFLLMILPFALELLPANMVVLMLPSFFCVLAVKPFLTKEKDAEVALLLRGAMIFGLLGLASCGIIING